MAGSSASIPYLSVRATIWAPQCTAAEALHSNSSLMSGGAVGELYTLLAGGSALAYFSIFSTLVTTVTCSSARVTTVKFLLGLDLYSSLRDQTRPSEPSTDFTLAILSSDVPGFNSEDNFGKITMSPLLTSMTILSLPCLSLTNRSMRVLLQVW